VAALREMELWRQAGRSRAFALLLGAIALCLVRARDQPSLDVGVAGTTVSIVAADAALAALAVTAVAVIARDRAWLTARWVVVSAAALCALILVTAAVNGAEALVAGAKLVELSALALGALALVRTRGRLEAVVDLLIAFTVAADALALHDYVRHGGGRQASFLGEHDFAALATMPLVYGLALVHVGGRNSRAALAVVAGGVGVSLGASLATLVGLYLGGAALLAVVAAKRALRLRPVLVTIAVIAAVTGATVFLRSGELGFLQSWFGKPAEEPGQYAASWSQRLIYAYVGGRVFLDHPVLGTGWWGELPPDEFVRYLPDARRRFSDQPPRYFPPRDHRFIPQQAYDQVLYELGLVGAAALAALLAALVVRCVAGARRARDALATLPAVWLGSAVGALAGEGLFGGTPLAAVVWLTFGLVAVLPLVAE
jgi:O-antigen ligase